MHTTGGVLPVLGGTGSKGHGMGLPFPAHLRAILSAGQVALFRGSTRYPQVLRMNEVQIK